MFVKGVYVDVLRGSVKEDEIERYIDYVKQKEGIMPYAIAVCFGCDDNVSLLWTMKKGSLWKMEQIKELRDRVKHD